MNYTDNFSKYTVITGASSGIGHEMAKEFAGHGSNLILAARRKDRLLKLKEEISSQYSQVDIILFEVDLSKPEEVNLFYEDTKKFQIETWINNAGRGYRSLVSEQDLDIARQLIHLNVESLTMLSTLYAADYKDVDGAQLINISSAAGYTVFPYIATYCATKFYVSAFTESMEQELRLNGNKLRAKVMAPAAVQTEFADIEQNTSNFNYDKAFGTYHTAKHLAECVYSLYESEKTVGIIDLKTYELTLEDQGHPHL